MSPLLQLLRVKWDRTRLISVVLLAGVGVLVAFGQARILLSVFLGLLVLGSALRLAGHNRWISTASQLVWVVLLANRALFARTTDSFATDLRTLLPEIAVTISVAIVAAVLLAMRLLDSARPLQLSVVKVALLGYVILVAMSIMWTPRPYYAVFWLMRLAAAVILGILGTESVNEARLFVGATVLGSLPSVTLPVLSYVQALEGGPIRADMRPGGVWFHPNNASVLAGSVFVLLLVSAMQSRHPLLLGVGASGVLASAVIAGGKTGFVAIFLALGTMLLIRPQSIRNRRLAWLALSMGGGLWLASTRLDVGLFAHARYYASLGDLPTLTARISLWMESIRVWHESVVGFLLGRGFTFTRVVGLPAGPGLGLMGHAHSAWVQTAVENGIVGVALLATVVVCTLRSGAQSLNTSSLARGVFGAFLVLLISSVTTTVFGGLVEPQTYAFIGFVLALDAPQGLGAATPAGNN